MIEDGSGRQPAFCPLVSLGRGIEAAKGGPVGTGEEREQKQQSEQERNRSASVHGSGPPAVQCDAAYRSMPSGHPRGEAAWLVFARSLCTVHSVKQVALAGVAATGHSARVDGGCRDLRCADAQRAGDVERTAYKCSACRVHTKDDCSAYPVQACRHSVQRAARSQAPYSPASPLPQIRRRLEDRPRRAISTASASGLSGLHLHRHRHRHLSAGLLASTTLGLQGANRGVAVMGPRALAALPASPARP